MALLELDNVSRIYSKTTVGFSLRGGCAEKAGTIRALNEVSLTIEPGQRLGIIGESGAGKTTLAEIAAGLIEPSSGSVRIYGKSFGKSRDERKRRARTVQLVLQNAPGALNPRLRVEKLIGEPLRIHGLASGDIRERVLELLGEAGLAAELADRYPHQLSGGELQRIVIARALALDPELLICDELASALDARVRNRVAALLERLCLERNLALLVVAHDLPLIRRLTDTLIVMYQGSVVEEGPTYKVLKQPRHPYTRLLVSAEPLLSTGREPVAKAPGS